MSKTVEVNGRVYHWPKAPLVVICCDGSEPSYVSVIPSFTNPNNMSIVTGQPPAIHGICGNYLIDPATGLETMMNDPKWLRAPTIFSTFQKAGAKVCVVTAKDKLRLLLGHGLVFDGSAICFSSEKADKATMEANGILDPCSLVGLPPPEVYSADLSEFVFAAGVKLLARDKPDLMYLSTTDYVQHKYAPGSDGANSFYKMMDGYLGSLDALGATVVIIADHGMKDKHLADGSPDVIYLQDVLDEAFGQGACKVILPITDPYVVHHGALGSYATVYLKGEAPDDVARVISKLEGIDVVYAKAEGCAKFGLPPDRTGDLIVLSGGPKFTKVIGTSAAKHDLSGLDAPLRSHGGLSEQEVPIIINRKVHDLPEHLRNFDAFYIGCNHV
jgi:phosphonoacetate hydrolase